MCIVLRSSWTDTPEDKARKALGLAKEEDSSTSLQREARERHIASRDEEQEKAARYYFPTFRVLARLTHRVFNIAVWISALYEPRETVYFPAGYFLLNLD